MLSAGDLLAGSAEKLVGTGYRLHGRDPATGLDCLGVVAASLSGIGWHCNFPTGYGLRNRLCPELDRVARRCGLAQADDDVLPGDILAVRPHRCQLHFVVSISRDRYVHAHAGLRRVTVTPWVEEWTIERHFRLISPS